MYAAESHGRIRFRAVGQSIAFPLLYILAVFRHGLLPFSIAGLASWAILRNAMPEGFDLKNPAEVRTALLNNWPVLAACYAVNVIAMSIYAVGIHRMIIGSVSPSFPFIRFKRHELAYLGAAMIFAVILTLTNGVLLASFWFLAREAGFAIQSIRGGGEGDAPTLVWLFSVLAAVAAIVLVLQISTRFVLILPHAAVSGRIAIGPSWRAMRGNVWLFIELSVILWIIIVALGVALVFALGSLTDTIGAFLAPYPQALQLEIASDRLKDMIGIGLLAVFSVMATTMNIALLSFIYRDLGVEWSDAAAEHGYA